MEDELPSLRDNDTFTLTIPLKESTYLAVDGFTLFNMMQMVKKDLKLDLWLETIVKKEVLIIIKRFRPKPT